MLETSATTAGVGIAAPSSTAQILLTYRDIVIKKAPTLGLSVIDLKAN